MPKTLLLADDSVTMQKVVGITFANEDVRLVTVDNGDDALERARDVKPSVVLADVGMPGLNGYELCAAIKSEPELKHIKVILLTGTFDTYDENRAREVGADAHVSKPFEAQALVDQVRSLITRAEAEGSGKGGGSLDDPHFDFEASASGIKPGVAAPPAPAREPARPAQSTQESVASAKPAVAAGRKDAIDDLYDDAGFGDSSEQESPILGRTPTPSGAGLGQTYDLVDDEPATDSGIFGEPFPDPGSLTEDTAPDLLVERDAQGVPLVEDEEPMIETLPEDDGDDVLDVSDELLEIPDDLEPPLTLTGPMQPKGPARPAPEPARPAAPAPAPAAASPKPAVAPKPAVSPKPAANAKPAASPKPAPVSMSGDKTLVADMDNLDDIDMGLDEPLWAEPLEEGPSLGASAAAEKPKPSAPRREAPVSRDSGAREPAARESTPRESTPRESTPRESAERAVALPAIDPQRIHDAIEKVAWEAFGPLAEQVVKEVSRKIEAIAWETIPMLAERIIREEIARLKQQQDDD